MRHSRKWGVGLIGAMVLSAFSAHAATHGVTDMTGQVQQVPASPRHIADLWFAHNELTIMLGAADRIAVTVDRPDTRPWMFRVAPVLYKAIGVNGPAVNAESLLKAGVDVAFVPNGSATAAALRAVGIPVLVAGFADVASLRRSLEMTAQVIGTPQARDVTRAYETMLDGVIHDTRARTDALAPDARPRVVHIQSLHPLRVDGAHTIIDEWLAIAGARNAADGVDGNMKPVSVEQVAAWNPDVIILGPDSGTFDPVADGGVWRNIRAVQAGRVVHNPAGVFPWDRYGSEFPLQVAWAAQVLHPDLFAATNMVEQTRAFYRDFFHYDLDAAQAGRILAGLPPADGAKGGGDSPR
ncbi:ABC transporter substrate-binding protein [Gluconacetobacter entanii]|uniref:ABC transporter substrate-binding protein n=1 Tax=Gluconacetobacter entanii TaxID=108528 RepID=UPI0021BBE4E6|nr:ABC transporter substrate-binding protein [Gluconacetobacter entanii]MCW4581289.1 ABC transporter substrate-binding protein [Gluconacetobacter entanii]MCW4584572.1 ABC transporter substrate-binding protein [Gluconacetobacter entanii]MCW4587986.1 ABC transporter substrate-binding protein [Gluconacetobacter entanii]